MQIKLTETELKLAVRSFIRNSGITSPIDEIEFLATRGNEGITTTVTIPASDENSIDAKEIAQIDRGKSPDKVAGEKPAKVEKISTTGKKTDPADEIEPEVDTTKTTSKKKESLFG